MELDRLTTHDPVCNRPDCHERNHCEHHDQPVHHAVDSMARWCAKRRADARG